MIATSEEELLLISEQNEVNLVGDESTCIVDSSASFHLTPNQKCFSSYRPEDLGTVKMGTERACQIVNIGDEFVVTSTGCRLVLRDVRHIPEVGLNLISVGLLETKATRVASGTVS